MLSSLISVVIPTYNRADKIARALDSVIAQDYRPIQIIIVDDYSNDNTLDLLISYKQNTTVALDAQIQFDILCHKKNMGISKSRNDGLALAKGEYIAFLDSDDEWIRSDKLTLQVDYLKKNIDCGFVGTGWANINNLSGPRFRDLGFSNLQDCPFALEYCLIHTSTWLVRSTIIKEIGGFLEGRCEDYDFLLRCGKYTKVACLPIVTELYYNAQGNHQENYMKDYFNTFRLIWRYRYEYKNFWTCFFKRLLRGFFKFFSFRKSKKITNTSYKNH